MSEESLVGVRVDGPGFGRSFTRTTCGSILVRFVRIIDDPNDPAMASMPSLWPEWLDEIDWPSRDAGEGKGARDDAK